MESSAPKRRKTSSSSSVSVDTNGNPSSDGATRRSTRNQRPSFASPTRASLARANPDILKRRDAEAAEREAGAAVNPRPESRGSNGSVSDLLTAQLEGASENRPASDEAEAVEGDGQYNAAPSEPPRSPVRRAMGGMAMRPRRSPNKPSPRPLPPPSQEEEELLGPFKGRALRRSPPPGVLPVTEHEEPDLPPTPTDKGLSDPAAISSSPKGIHSTPTKRPRRSALLAGHMSHSPLNSSPLKHPPLRPINLGKRPVVSSQALGRISQNISNATGEAPRYAVEKSSEAEGRTPRSRSHRIRGIPEEDPHAEKQSLRDSLLAEVAALQADLGVVRKENKRVHQLQQSRSDAFVSREPEDRDVLIDILKRHVLSPEKEPPPTRLENWLKAALDPMSFLPFGNPALTFPAQFLQPEKTIDENQSPPISHHPIAMTAKEELPYLQLFTPLTFTSSVSMVPRDDDTEDSGPLMQYTISVSSTPRGLFGAKIEMIVNTKTLSVAELSVPRLDPCAVPELGPFVKKIIEGSSNSALKRNISVITWAMSEWTRLATKRARFLVQLEREMGSREGILECVQKVRKERKRRRGRRPPTEEDEEQDDGMDDKKTIKKAELLPHLGRTSLDLDLNDPEDEGQTLGLRLSWRIEIDWTGEGQSKLGILVEAPGKWHAIDGRKSLIGIPEMFNKLIHDGVDPMDATRTVVALLVGDKED